MDITIYEDQTGLMLFPVEKTEKNIQIVSFFNNNIDLFLEKIGDNLAIYCHLIASKASSRPIGYYVIFKDVYNDQIFSNFKKEINNVLFALEIIPRLGHSDNIIFEEIERFDDSYQYYKEEIDIVREAIDYGYLEYSAGNIKDISSFCKDLLKTIRNIRISIMISTSSPKNELGNINILLNKKQAEPLKRIGNTEQKINDVRQLSKEKKKKEDGIQGILKIKEGVDKVKEGSEILKKVGYNNTEIRNEISNSINGIIGGFPTNGDKLDKENGDGNGIKIKHILIAGVVIMISLSIIYWPFVSQSLLGLYNNYKTSNHQYDNIINNESKSPLPTIAPTVLESTVSIEPTATIVVTSDKTSTITQSNSAIENDVEMNKSGQNLRIIKHEPPNVTSSIIGGVTEFYIVINQKANVTWRFNDEVRFYEDVNNSTYTNSDAAIGIWNVSVIAKNANGTVSNKWIWTIIGNNKTNQSIIK